MLLLLFLYTFPFLLILYDKRVHQQHIYILSPDRACIWARIHITILVFFFRVHFCLSLSRNNEKMKKNYAYMSISKLCGGNRICNVHIFFFVSIWLLPLVFAIFITWTFLYWPNAMLMPRQHFVSSHVLWSQIYIYALLNMCG